MNLTWLIVLFSALIASFYAVADSRTANQFEGLITFRSVDSRGYAGWDSGQAGKLIEKDADARLHAVIDYRRRLTDNIHFNTTFVTQDPDFGKATGFTEFFFNWKPVPSGPIKHSLKFGVFYPPVSLDNSGTGWTGASSNNFSAINTWIAEEVRVAGLETNHKIRFNWLDRPHQIKLITSLFMNNDSAGALLAWKGWSLHERQTRWDDQLTAPEIPALQSGGAFERQADFIDPYREIDDEPGYYAGFNWRFNRTSLFNYLYYDNRADPSVIIDGQYGWHTRFSALGFTSQINKAIVKAQWMKGRTQMGKLVGGKTAVDNDFEASYLQVSRNIGAHTLTLRRDWFSVDDQDRMSVDPNGETGNAWTVSYHWDTQTELDYSLEWLRIETDREAWRFLGESPQTIERQVIGKFIYTF